MFPTLDAIKERLPDTPESQRFLSHIKVGPVPAHNPDLGPCLLWTAACDDGGYGAFRVGKQMQRAHVWLFKALGGVIPAGMQLDHICHEPKLCTVPHRQCPHRPCALHVTVASPWENIVLRGNGPTAKNFAKTHCVGKYSPRAADGTVIGHPWYNPDGTFTEHVYIAPSGTLKCKSCQRIRERVWGEKARALRAQARSRNLPDAGQLVLLDV